MNDDSHPPPLRHADEAAGADFPPVPPISDERTAAWLAATARLQLAQHRAREMWHRQQAEYWAGVLQTATSDGDAQKQAATAMGGAESAPSATDLQRRPTADAASDGDIRIITTQQPPPRDAVMGMRRSDEPATGHSLSVSRPVAQSPSRADETEPGRAVDGAADGALYPMLSSPMRRESEFNRQQQQQQQQQRELAPDRTERRSSWESQSRGASPLPRAALASSSSSSSSSSSLTSRAPPLQHLTLSRPSISRQKGPDSAGLTKGAGGSSKRTKPHGGRGILASWFGLSKRKAEVSGPFNVRKMSTGASVSNVAAAARASSFHAASSEGGPADAAAPEYDRAPSRASASPQQSSTKQSPASGPQPQQQYQQQQQQQQLPPVALAPPSQRLSLGQLLNVAQASPNSRSSSAHNSPESNSSNDSSYASAMQSQQQQQQQQYQQQHQTQQHTTQPPSLQKPRSLPPTPYVSISAPSSRSASPLRILPGEAARQAARDPASQLVGPMQGGRAFSPTLPPHLGTDGSSSAPDAALAAKKHNWPGPPPLLSQMGQQQYPSGSASPSAPLQSPPSLPATAPASPFATEMSGVSISMRQSSPPPLPPFAGARAPVQMRSQSQPSSPVLSESQAAAARRSLFEQSVSGTAGGSFAQGQQLQMGLEAAAQFQRRKEKAGTQQPNATATGPPPIPPPKPAALEKLLTQQRPPLHHYHAHASVPSGTNLQPGTGASSQWDKDDKSALVGSSKSGGSASINLDDPSTALKFERMRNIPPPPPPTSRPQRDLA